MDIVLMVEFVGVENIIDVQMYGKSSHDQSNFRL